MATTAVRHNFMQSVFRNWLSDGISGLMFWGIMWKNNSSFLVTFSLTLTVATICDLTLRPLTSYIYGAPSNASIWQMGFNSAFKGLNTINL